MKKTALLAWCLTIMWSSHPASAQNAQAFGDSITIGTGASVPANAWVNIVASTKGWQLINSGVGGSQLTDYQIDAIRAAKTPLDNNLLLLGFNDMRAYGIDPVGLATYTGTLYDALAWLAIPAQEKVLGQSTAVSYKGTWSNTPVAGAVGKYTSQATGASATFSVSGSSVYISTYTVSSAQTGQFSITIDGVNHGTVNCFGMRASGNGRTYAPSMTRITGLTNTAHTVTLTKTSIFGGINDAVFFDWAAGSASTSVSKANVYFGNTLRMTALGYTIDGPSFSNGSDSAVASFNAVNNQIATALASDGWAVQYVDASSVYDPNTEVSSDNVHPGDKGHAAIAAAFLSLTRSSGFQPGTYAIGDAHGLRVDGGLTQHGAPAVEMWSYIANDAAQHWIFTQVSGGYTIRNEASGAYASSGQGNVLVEGSTADVWTLTLVSGGYTIKNNRTGSFLVDPGSQGSTIALRKTGSVWSMLNPN